MVSVCTTSDACMQSSRPMKCICYCALDIPSQCSARKFYNNNNKDDDNDDDDDDNNNSYNKNSNSNKNSSSSYNEPSRRAAGVALSRIE